MQPGSDRRALPEPLGSEMKHRSPSTSQLAATGLLLALIGTAACESRQPISPDDVQIRAAKPPKDGGEEIVVLSAVPSEGEQGAVGLKIHVFGEGFAKGAKVAFHLSEDETDPDEGMTVQSTEFVSSQEVIATTDIALDAEVSSRYVSVAFRGRRGIGTEALFQVKENSGIGQLEPTPVSVRLNSGVFTNPATDPGVYIETCNVAARLAAVNGNLALGFKFNKNLFKGKDRPDDCPVDADGQFQRKVHVEIPGKISDDRHGRIYTNNTTLSDGTVLTDGLADLRVHPGDPATTVLAAQVGSQLNFGQECPYGVVVADNKVNVTYLTDPAGGGPRWEIWSDGEETALYCTGGGQFPDQEPMSALLVPVSITVFDDGGSGGP